MIIGVVSGALAITSWLVTFSELSFLPALSITNIEVYGADPSLTPVMNAAASKAIDGTYLGIFSKANTLIYPRNAISKWIASSSPSVSNVNVGHSSLNTLSISVSEKTPDAIVCADLPDLSSNSLSQSDKCYVTDSTGLIFRLRKESDQNTYNQYYIPDLAGKELLGTYATSTAKFRILQSLINNLKYAGINVQATLIKGGHDYELYADNPSGSSIVVIQMDDRVNLDVEKDNLIAFWSKVTGDARTKGTKLEWSEIKLQYPPNVYSRPIEGSESSTGPR